MRNEDIRELLEAKLSGFKAELKSGMDMQTYKLDELIDYQKEQNGRIGKLEKETSFFRLIHNHPRISTIVSAILILGMTLGTVYLSHHVNVKKTIENKTGIVINE